MPLIPADALTRVLAGQDPDQPQAPVPPKPIPEPLQKFAAAPLAPGNYPDNLPPALERFAANPLGRRNYSPRGVFRHKQ